MPVLGFFASAAGYALRNRTVHYPNVHDLSPRTYQYEVGINDTTATLVLLSFSFSTWGCV